jgi:hypothetical protein
MAGCFLLLLLHPACLIAVDAALLLVGRLAAVSWWFRLGCCLLATDTKCSEGHDSKESENIASKNDSVFEKLFVFPFLLRFRKAASASVALLMHASSCCRACLLFLSALLCEVVKTMLLLLLHGCLSPSVLLVAGFDFSSSHKMVLAPKENSVEKNMAGLRFRNSCLRRRCDLLICARAR